MARKWLTIAFGFRVAHLLVSLILVLGGVLLGQGKARELASDTATSSTFPVQLKVGQAIQAELSVGQSYSYVVALEAGQYMRLVVTHAGFALRLSSIDSKETFLHLELQGPVAHLEPICWIAKASGKYRGSANNRDKSIQWLRIQRLQHAAGREGTVRRFGKAR
jgi:hypothetical protein